MKIHYFQRYKQKENVATANTMLLLSRFYAADSGNFYSFMITELFRESFAAEIDFTMQERNGVSVPDAIVSQESFKIVVETKIEEWFYKEQLEKHLNSFNNENYKLILSIARESMSEEKRKTFEKDLEEYNLANNISIRHRNITFLELTKLLREYIRKDDFQMLDILQDYEDYCEYDGLFPDLSSQYAMRMQLAGTTFEFNKESDLYYDGVSRGFRKHTYLGLYKEKSVRLIGKICARIIAVEDENGELILKSEFGEITEERKEKIQLAIKDADKYGYNLHQYEHRYFFVEKFYETDFKKISPKGAMGTKYFYLSDELNTKDLPDVKTIAELLREKTWE